ncbi:MAG: galactose-1-phosphate uridylyltransferase, partial [Spirochaetaceae bacterium]|nr:galactose-1-phosphate uridylyltransferase [Spirochaetaceae bacterium]
MMYNLIRQLVEYGLDCGLVQPEDTIYTANRLFALFKLDGDDAAIPAHTGQAAPRGHQLEPLLAALLDWAYDHGLLEGNSVDYRDILDTAIMGCLTPPP